MVNLVLGIASVMFFAGAGFFLAGMRGKVVEEKKQRNPAFIVIGLVLLAPVLFYGIRIVMVIQSGEHPNTLKPNFWLVQDAMAEVTTPEEEDAVEETIDSIVERIENEKIDQAALKPLVDLGLASLTDGNKKWVHGYGLVIEKAKRNGLLSDEDFKAYAKGKLTLKLEARKRVTFGDMLPVKLSHALRDNGHASSAIRFEVKLSSLKFGGGEAKWEGVAAHFAKPEQAGAAKSLLSDMDWSIDASTGRSAGFVPTTGPEGLPAELEAGPSKVAITMKATAYDLTGTKDPTAGTELVSWDMTLDAPVEVVPKGETSTELKTGEEVEKEVKRFVRFLWFTVNKPDKDGKQELSFRYITSKEAMLCHRAVAKVGDKTQYLGHVLANQDAQRTITLKLEGLKVGDKVTVILTPDPDAAARRLEVTEIFGGELQFDDVPVKDPSEVVES